jgi:hypothetical protein
MQQVSEDALRESGKGAKSLAMATTKVVEWLPVDGDDATWSTGKTF